MQGGSLELAMISQGHSQLFRPGGCPGQTGRSTVRGKVRLGEDGRGVYLLATSLIRVSCDRNFLAPPSSVT